MKNTERFCRFTALLLCVLMVLCALGGCKGKDSAPTTVVFTEDGEKELPLVTVLVDVTWISDNLQNILREIPGSDREFHLAVEMLTREAPQRANRLTELRTELMAGKGPDVFLIDQANTVTMMGMDGKPMGAVFQFPEQAMAHKVFLPLDDYMKSAQLTDFSRQLPVIMEAGRNEEGQQLLPMGYNITMNSFAEKFADEDIATREAMLSSGSLALEFFASMGYNRLDYFGQEADFEAEKLNFTEEELLEEAKLWRNWREKFQAGEYDSIPDEDKGMSKLSMGAFGGGDRTLVPARNRDGGITAYIEAFGAINRNTPYPDYSFLVLDKLCSKSVQSQEFLYAWGGGMITDMDLNAPGEMPIYWLTMSEPVYEWYVGLWDQITAVRLVSALDMAAYEEIYVPMLEGAVQDDQALERAVHKAYTTMEMMLAES